jgi:hypothetical protein
MTSRVSPRAELFFPFFHGCNARSIIICVPQWAHIGISSQLSLGWESFARGKNEKVTD